MVLFSSDDELSGERKRTKRRANTINLKNMAIGGSDEDEAPGFARPTLALSTKSKKGTKRFDDILSELSDLSSDEQPLSVWQRSRTFGPIPTPTLEVESHGGHGVLDKAGMDELRAMKSSISEVPLFQNCSPKFVEAIAEQVSHRLFTPGVDIMTEGEYGDSMYILHRGDVEVIIGGTTVCTLSDGAVFGEIAALCKNPLLARRTATIRALTLCDCRVTYRDSLLKVMSRFKGDEEIVSRKLETRIVELQKMGKLPSQKEWRRAPVKQQAAAVSSQDSMVAHGQSHEPDQRSHPSATWVTQGIRRVLEQMSHLLCTSSLTMKTSVLQVTRLMSRGAEGKNCPFGHWRWLVAGRMD